MHMQALYMGPRSWWLLGQGMHATATLNAEPHYACIAGQGSCHPPSLAPAGTAQPPRKSEKLWQGRCCVRSNGALPWPCPGAWSGQQRLSVHRRCWGCVSVFPALLADSRLATHEALQDALTEELAGMAAALKTSTLGLQVRRSSGLWLCQGPTADALAPCPVDLGPACHGSPCCMALHQLH